MEKNKVHCIGYSIRKSLKIGRYYSYWIIITEVTFLVIFIIVAYVLLK